MVAVKERTLREDHPDRLASKRAFILKHEPNIDKRDRCERTPLHWAAGYGSLAAVKIC
jgi:hypothetical protein